MLTTSFPAYEGDFGGFFVHELAKSLTKLNSKVKVITPIVGDSKKHEIMDSVEVCRFSYFWPKKYQRLTGGFGGIPVNIKKSMLAKIQLPFLMLSFFIHSLKETRECDILHAHWIPAGLVAIVCKIFYKKKVVLTERDPIFIKRRNLITRFIIRFVLKNVDKICIISSSLNADLRNYGIKNDKIEVITNGVDTDKFKPIDNKKIREKLNLPQDSIIIISVSTLIKRKGIFYLLEAFNSLVQKNKNVFLLIIGDGPEKSSINNYIENKNLTEKVRLIEFINRNEIDRWIVSSDILVSSSLAETGPNTVLEAMSSSTPVIATRVGICPDIIKDGINGYLVLTEDSNDIYEKMIYLQDKEKRVAIGKNARETILKDFSWEKCAKDYLEAYKSVLS